MVSIREKINNILEEYDNVDDCIYEIKKMFEDEDISDFEIEHEHVYDNPGVDVIAIAVAWNDWIGLHVYCGSIDI